MAVNNQVLQKMVDQANQKAPKSGAGGKIVAVLLTAIIIGGGVWAYDNFMVIKVKDQTLTESQNKVTELDNQNKNLAQQLNNLNQEKVDEAKKLLPYSNAQYGYSLSYPANYILSDHSDINSHNLQLQSPDNSNNIIFMISKTDPKIIYDIQSEGNINVAGILAGKYSHGGVGTFEAPMTEVRFDKDGKTYSFQFYDVTDITDQNLEILNSFQFNN